MSDKLFDRRFALLLGAGFSKWALDLPLASELFDLAIQPNNQREHARLRLLSDDWHQWYSRTSGGHVEDYIADCERSARRRRRAAWYITRRLSEPFFTRIVGGRATYMIDDRRRFQVPGIVTARNFLQYFASQDVMGYVTTNYDLVLEYALGTKLFNYGKRYERLKGRGPGPRHGLPGKVPVALHGWLPIAKLHGSLSWSAESRYTDGCAGVSGRALIVPPMPPKAMPPAIADVWATARGTLANSTDLLVFGFSFHPRDTHVRELLASAGRHIERIHLVDLYPPLELVRSMWPNADVTASLPHDMRSILNWRGPSWVERAPAAKAG